MPPTRFTPEELRKGAELIADPDNQPAVIEKRYRMGEITLKDKLEHLRAYGQIQKELAIAEGDFQAKKKTGEVQAGLEKAPMGGGTGPGKGAAGEFLYWAGSVVKGYDGMWQAYQSGEKGKLVMRSLMTALEAAKIFDVPGDAVEREALNAGASPGLARAANWAVWLPTNFLGLTQLLKPVTATGGAGIRGYRAVREALKDEKAFLKDPVGYVTKQARAIDSSVAVEATETATKKATTGTAKTATQAVTEPPGIKSPQEIEKLTLDNIIGYYDERAAKMVRSGVSHEQTAAAATAKGPTSIHELLGRGADEAVSATEMERIGKVHEQVSNAFESVFDEAFKNADDLGQGLRPDLMNALKTHLLAMEVTNPAFLSARGQTGRGLEYMKTMTELSSRSVTWDNVLKSLSADVIHNGNDEAVATAVKKLGLLNVENRAYFISEVAKDKASPGMLHSLFKNLLFLSPSTHVVNTTGSIANATGKVGLDYLSAFTPGGPALSTVNAEVGGVLDSMMHLPRLWRQSVERSATKVSKYATVGEGDILAKYGTGRAMAIEDELIGGILESGLVKGEAMKRVTAQGITDKAAQKLAIDEMIKDPKQLDELIKAVAPDVDYTMWHAPLSKSGEKFAEWARNSPFDFWLPVVKFPINEIKMARDWTPGLQVLSKKFADEIAAGGERAAQANTRMALSWMLANTIWAGAKSGLITGGGPQDPAAKAIWLKNNKPYSINGYDYRWAAGFVEVIGAAADMAQFSNEMDPDEVSQFASALTLTMGRMVENNWALRVFEGVTNVMSDVKHMVSGSKKEASEEQAAAAEEVAPEGQLSPSQRKLNDLLLEVGKVVFAPVATVTGGGTVGGKIRENLDPEVKDVRTIADFFLSKIPGSSNNVRPKLNWSGKVEVTPATIGSRWLNLVLPAVRPKTGDEDPVAAWMTKHEITHDDNWKSYESTFLSGDESHDFKHIAFNEATDFNGDTWNQAIERMEADPEFQGKARAEKQQQFNRTYNRFQKEAWTGLKNVNPVIAERERITKDMRREAKGKPPYEAFGLSVDVSEAPQQESHDVEYVPTPMPVEPQESATQGPQPVQ